MRTRTDALSGEPLSRSRVSQSGESPGSPAGAVRGPAYDESRRLHRFAGPAPGSATCWLLDPRRPFRAAEGADTRPEGESIPVQRRLASVLVAVLGLFVLSGCIRADMELTVGPDDTVDGTMLMAISSEFTESLEGILGDGVDPEDLLAESGGIDEELLAGIDGDVQVEPYDEGEWVGEKVTFSNVTLEDFNQSLEQDASPGQGGSFSLTREGDTYVFDSTFELDGGEEQDLESAPAEMRKLFERFAEEAEVRFSVTFPGEVVETNGEVDGTTVTWETGLQGATRMRAVAEADGPAPDRSGEEPGSDAVAEDGEDAAAEDAATEEDVAEDAEADSEDQGSVPLVPVLVAGALVLVLAVGGWLVVRRRASGSTATGA